MIVDKLQIKQLRAAQTKLLNEALGNIEYAAWKSAKLKFETIMLIDVILKGRVILK